MELPIFKYHPEPLNTGSIEKTQQICECCEQVRGYKATSSIYSIEEITSICPWCIFNGEAASKFDGSFSDAHPLLQDGIDKIIVKEVCERTPSFISWQQERWLSHCNDACEYHGDAKEEDLAILLGEDLNDFLKDLPISEREWSDMLKNYNAGRGCLAIHKFKCRGCGSNRFYGEYD